MTELYLHVETEETELVAFRKSAVCPECTTGELEHIGPAAGSGYGYQLHKCSDCKFEVALEDKFPRTVFYDRFRRA